MKSTSKKISNDVNERRELLLSLLGPLPAREGPVKANLIERQAREGYVLERLVLELNDMERVPAMFVSPADAPADKPLPTVLYNHSHGGRYEVGKAEMLAPHPYDQNPAYAAELTRRGWRALAIDHWAFGERRGRTEGEMFKEFLWRGQVMWGLMVHDSLRALDYLVSRPDVDASRLGTIGMSMGSTMAWWVAALDERVRVTVDLCCLTEFEDLVEAGDTDGHGVYYYVPGLLNHFTCAEINALIAPRPHLGLAGRYDRLTPMAGLKKIDAHLRNVYKSAGADNAWKLSIYETGHVQTAAMRKEAMEFLERFL